MIEQREFFKLAYDPWVHRGTDDGLGCVVKLELYGMGSFFAQDGTRKEWFASPLYADFGGTVRLYADDTTDAINATLKSVVEKVKAESASALQELNMFLMYAIHVGSLHMLLKELNCDAVSSNENSVDAAIERFLKFDAMAILSCILPELSLIQHDYFCEITKH